MMNVNAELFVMRVLAGYDPIYGYTLDHLSFLNQNQYKQPLKFGREL